MSKKNIEMSFDENLVSIDLSLILPTKPVNKAVFKTKKYIQILKSIEALGIIEPPAVCKDGDKYILLDGHLRVEALKSLNIETVQCLIAKDDEAFTYNKYINRLSTIQEHKMILRSIEQGVSEDKIAKALCVDVSSIIRKKNLLDGICLEASDILKDKIIAAEVFKILKKMKPLRQMQVATLMSDANIYSTPYARALLAATQKEDLINPEKPKKVKGLTEEQMSRMEDEMENLDREYRLAEDNYSTDILNLTLAKGYLTKILDNTKIVKYLAEYHAGVLAQFQKIVHIQSINSANQEH